MVVTAVIIDCPFIMGEGGKWGVGGRSAFAAGCLGGGEREDRMCHWRLPGWTAKTI